MTTQRYFRVAIFLELAGLVVVALSLLRLRPGTFMLFMALGLPLILVGVIMGSWAVYRRLAEVDRVLEQRSGGPPRSAG